MATKNKPYNNGQWTIARFNSFVKGMLRAGARRWPPKYAVKKAAWVRRGIYLCAGYEQEPHEIPVTLNKENNVFVDHIEPVIDPVVGFVGWDSVVERLLVEAEGMQVLCKACHMKKTTNERTLARLSKKNLLDDSQD